MFSISSNQFSQEQVILAPEIKKIAGSLGDDLEKILREKNGFFAFECALRFFPCIDTKESFGLSNWNSDNLWRDDYEGLAENCIFFAEDVFGGQFCIKDNTICFFDPETGDYEEIACSFGDWAAEVLENYNFWTGYSLAREWQELNGRLPFDRRLMPKLPFVCGGKYEVDNLISINVISCMKSRANLARQIVNLSDGSKIEFKIID